MWKVEKIVSKGEYNYAVVRDHPHSSKYGYVLHHRIVVENHLGRLLNSNEIVHHKNGFKKDNRIENLEVMDVIEHTKHHSNEKGRKWVKLKCPECSISFDRTHNNTHLSKNGRYTCCSRSCSAKFSRFIQIRGITHEVEEAISGNIIVEYRIYSNDNPEQTV